MKLPSRLAIPTAQALASKLKILGKDGMNHHETEGNQAARGESGRKRVERFGTVSVLVEVVGQRLGVMNEDQIVELPRFRGSPHTIGSHELVLHCFRSAEFLQICELPKYALLGVVE